MAELTFFKIAKRNKGLYMALAGLLVAAVVINFATGVNFFKLSNLLNVTRSFCILGIASIGQAIVIISGSGGLDLSIGHVISTANVIAAALMEGSNALFIPVTLLILLFGVSVGLINGLLVTKRNVPPFIATLGMGIVLKGLRFMWTEGLPKGKVPAILIEIGNGSSFGIPNLFFVFLIIVIAASVMLNSTGYGRRLYAVGTNRATATLNGVKSERVIIMAYIISSVLAALVGVLMAGYMGMPEPKIGDNKEFESLVAAVLGGVAITGGFGSVQGVIIGVLLMLLVTNLSLLIQVPIQSQYLIIGLLIIVALWINERKKAGAT